MEFERSPLVAALVGDLVWGNRLGRRVPCEGDLVAERFQTSDQMTAESLRIEVVEIVASQFAVFEIGIF